MNVLENWFCSNTLTLNNAKTETMTLALKDIARPNPLELKFLGIYLDLSLKLNRHVDLLAGSLSYHFLLYYRHIMLYFNQWLPMNFGLGRFIVVFLL